MRDQTSQHNRPGVGHIIAIGLAYFIAVAAVLIAIGLTIDDAYRNMDNSIIIGIDAIAATAAGVAIQMHCSYLAQVRVLDGQAEIINLINLRSSELAADTGQIPRITESVMTPEVIVVEIPERIHQSVDREAAMAVLDEAKRRQDGNRDQYWNAYADAVNDLSSIGITEGETPESQ